MLKLVVLCRHRLNPQGKVDAVGQNVSEFRDIQRFSSDQLERLEFISETSKLLEPLYLHLLRAMNFL
ncbi:hypothetical protein EG332_04700 [Pectobacterium versatile]|nr:hypothetical protein DF215_11085 [Pectobacterium versatile]TAI99377.1 hypothetical protein EG332_04700 [Pectobacterium versatile]